ncbi:right-handed parallel beta-helix repeat-containing protein, partial [Candidatus Woesearchaeota archaeon]|nr:right-handed parallel beta-helix repeat-containing protein [Candidatus Woesearchaeota archaeon]
SKYVDFSNGNRDENGWIYFNISYSEGDVTDEDSLAAYEFGTSRWISLDDLGETGVDTTNNIVYGNFTDSGGDYAIMEDLHQCGRIDENNFYGDCECGDAVMADMDFEENMTCSGTALTINASDITIDCNGGSIAGDGTGDGIIIAPGSDRVTITNCEISNFIHGINNDDPMADSGDNLTISYNLIHDTDYAVYSRQNDNWVHITGNEMHTSEIGIDLYDSRNEDIISGNVIYDIFADAAIKLSYGTYAQINNNQINNSVIGIYLYEVHNSTISGNTIGEVGTGIEVYSSDANTVQSNNLTDVTSEGGIKIHTGSNSNIITGNTVKCTESSKNYYGIGVIGSITPAENSQMSGNELYNCEYGLYALDVTYFSADSEEYHDNWYGAFLDDVGFDDDTMPAITESETYNNIDGIYVIGGSYAYIENTDFTENNDITSGLHVGFGSTVYLNSGDFISNSVYGINADGTVYWSLGEDVYCTDNDIVIADGWIVPMGGNIIADTCSISVNGEDFNMSGGQVGYYTESFSAGMPDFGSSDYGVSGEIYTLGGYPGGDLVVKFYNENPGGSGFYLEEFGLWIDASLDPDPGANLDWWILRIHYTDEELAASGLRESELEIQFYNATNSSWYREPNQGVNTTDNYVWANLTHFSVFGIFGSAATGGGGGSTSRCSDECDSGEVLCRDGSMLVCQYSSSLGCWKWAEEYCALNEECVDGKCVEMACVEDWICDNWGECSGGTQTRACEDWNSCGTSVHKPATSRACTVTEEGAVVPVEAPPATAGVTKETKPQKSKAAIAGGIIALFAVVALALKFGLGYFTSKKKP